MTRFGRRIAATRSRRLEKLPSSMREPTVRRCSDGRRATVDATTEKHEEEVSCSWWRLVALSG